MEINLLDFIVWMIITFLILAICGDEMGILIGGPIAFLFTIFWIVLFCIFDYNVYDIGVWVYENVRIIP